MQSKPQPPRKQNTTVAVQKNWLLRCCDAIVGLLLATKPSKASENIALETTEPKKKERQNAVKKSLGNVYYVNFKAK